MITSSYFKGFINVAVATAPNSDLLGDDVLLNRMIKKYEPELLIKLLGYPLYKEYLTGLEATSGIWYELINGKEYLVDDLYVKWDGLIFNDGETDRSLMANYIYYFYLLYKQKTLSGVGMIRNDAKNATSVNSNQEAMFVWNEFVDMVMVGNNGNRSLYQFIQDQNDLVADTYADWYPTPFEYNNSLGL